MITVGSLIKSKRISKNLSIDQIAQELKIQKNILQKIENDELAENINAVFIIGHLKSYSEYLELNTSEIIANFKLQISFKKNDLVESIKRPSVNTNMFSFIKFVPTTLIMIIFTSFYFQMHILLLLLETKKYLYINILKKIKFLLFLTLSFPLLK